MKKLLLPVTLSLGLAGLLGLFHIGGILLLLGGIFLLRHFLRVRRLPYRPANILRFMWDFLVDLVKSSLILAWDILTPRDIHRVSLVRIPVEDLSDPEIILLNHRINLSPGTLVYRIARDHSYLLVHDMYGTRPDRAKELRAPIDILRGNVKP